MMPKGSVVLAQLLFEQAGFLGSKAIVGHESTLRQKEDSFMENFTRK